MKKALESDQRCRTYQYYGAQKIFATTGLQNANYSWYDSPNQIRAIALTLAGEVPAINLNQSSNLEFKKSVHRWYLRNNSNVPICVTEYDVSPRIDLTTAAGAPTQFTATPISAWDQGLILQGMAANFYQFVGCLPTESVDFNTNFRIMKVRTYVMGVGQTLLRSKKRTNWSIQYSKCSDADQVAVKGMTHSKVFVVHGHAVAAAGSMTLSEANLGILHHSKFVFRNSQDYISDLQKSFTIGALGTVGGNVLDYSLSASTATTSV